MRFHVEPSDQPGNVDLTAVLSNMGWVTTIPIADIPVVIKKLAAYIPEEVEA